MNGFWAGLLLVVLSGVMGGSFTIPQKYIRGWAWERSWLLYSVAGMVVFPWLLVVATVPRPVTVYVHADPLVLARTALYGAGWGIGSVLFGLGVAHVGTALAFAIVVSLTAALGTLAPLALQHPEHMATGRGGLLFAGLALVIVGLVLCARAGALKEAATPRQDPVEQADTPSRSFYRGLIICIASGLTSPMLNLSVAFGKPIAEEAVRRGAAAATASITFLAVAISSGFLVNGGYCLYLLRSNHSWRKGAEDSGVRNPLFTVVMGFLWMFGMFLYGLGQTQLGDLGPVVGWPLLMTLMVLTANGWGIATGEWSRAGRLPFYYLQVGNAAMVVALVLISQGAQP
ncbi:MAG TPA: L-rhamnose/proton symporter RhaT [Gemmataceae bacterium]|jgi:L-rhamnose-H+ transport protein|nr:L-rhamnose/proton symporter RhaT [Gemmataceae bacterium]